MEREGGHQQEENHGPSNAPLSALQTFWRNQMAEIENSNDFRSHGLPRQRIKRIMKQDENIKVYILLIF